MNTESIDILNALTSEFYARCADSFSATRERPWHGWDRCVDAIAEGLPGDPVSVLDIACGNLRFEKFLAQRLDADLICHAIDSCPELVPNDLAVRFRDVDIIETLRARSLLEEIEAIPQCDLACSFGFLHHIPTTALRLDLLDAMIEKTRMGGFIAISLWQFARDDRLRSKAEDATERALADHPTLELEEGDWLLGWQDSKDAFRYCHSFSEDEVAGLIEHAAASSELIARFQADGKQDDLNRYLVFRKRA